MVPGSLLLCFDTDLVGGHANNFLVQNVMQALIDKLVVKFEGSTLQDTVGYDIYKTLEDLFVPVKWCNNMVPEGIQSEKLNKMRLKAWDKASDVAETKLNEIFRSKYRIKLDHEILTNHSIFYPQALYNDVVFTINGSPKMVYNKGMESQDMWKEASCFFVKEKSKTKHMTLQKFYTGNRFGLLIDLRSMADQTMHGSGTQFVNTTDSIQLEIERKITSSGDMNCHIFVISNAQLMILGRQLESVQC